MDIFCFDYIRNHCFFHAAQTKQLSNRRKNVLGRNKKAGESNKR